MYRPNNVICLRVTNSLFIDNFSELTFFRTRLHYQIARTLRKVNGAELQFFHNSMSPNLSHSFTVFYVFFSNYCNIIIDSSLSRAGSRANANAMRAQTTHADITHLKT